MHTTRARARAILSLVLTPYIDLFLLELIAKCVSLTINQSTDLRQTGRNHSVLFFVSGDR